MGSGNGITCCMLMVILSLLVPEADSACTEQDTSGCDEGYMLFYDGDTPYCMTYEPTIRPRPVFYQYPSQISKCDRWLTIPSDNQRAVKLKCKKLTENSILTSNLRFNPDEYPEGWFGIYKDAKVPSTYDQLKAGNVTLWPTQGQAALLNCLAGYPEDRPPNHRYLHIISNFQFVGFNMVAVCPQSGWNRWQFYVTPEAATTTSAPLPCDLVNPCQNGAECINKDDGTAGCDCSSVYNLPMFAGYNGDHCEKGCLIGCERDRQNGRGFKPCLRTKKLLKSIQVMPEDKELICAKRKEGPKKEGKFRCATECDPSTHHCKPISCRAEKAFTNRYGKDTIDLSAELNDVEDLAKN